MLPVAVVASSLLQFEFYTQVKNDCEKGKQHITLTSSYSYSFH